MACDHQIIHLFKRGQFYPVLCAGVSSRMGGIEEVKSQLKKHFQTKNLGQLGYFLGIEATRCKRRTVVSWRKYVHDLLTDTGMLDYKPSDTFMDSNLQLEDEKNPKFETKRRLRSLVRNLLYLAATKPDITSVVTGTSRYMQTKPKTITLGNCLQTPQISQTNN